MKFVLFILVFTAACAHKQKNFETVPVDTVVSGYAPVNGLKMYYEIHGEGYPLVLIHGGGSTIDSNFSQMIPLLAKNHKVIAIEEQGHGHTAAIDRPFTFENSADDVAALLDYLKIDRADVMGFSNGGNITLRLAMRHPEKVDRLIVASAMYRRDGMVKGFWEGMKHAKLSDMPKELQAADQKINPDPKHLEQLFNQDSFRMKSFTDWSEKDMKSVQAQTLVLVGDQDIVTVDHALKISKILPRARLAVLPANHGSYLGEAASNTSTSRIPEATYLIIEEFISCRTNTTPVRNLAPTGARDFLLGFE